MRGAIPPLHSTSSWRGTLLSSGTTLPFLWTFVLEHMETDGAPCDVVEGWIMLLTYERV